MSKIKEVASKLIERDLSKVEIIEILGEYFPGDLTEKILCKIYLDGLKNSFVSSNPFLTAGMFHKNMSKCVPNSCYILSESSARTFKNMILGMSTTKIKINNYEDYQNTRQKFKYFFDIEPPSSFSILNAILNDIKSMDKISRNPQLINKIASILIDLNPVELNKLAEKRVNTINTKIDNLKFEKMFVIEENELISINHKIKRLEDYK